MNTELDNERQDEAEAALFAALPSDFPRPTNLGAVPGAQPKFNMNVLESFEGPGSISKWRTGNFAGNGH